MATTAQRTTAQLLEAQVKIGQEIEVMLQRGIKSTDTTGSVNTRLTTIEARWLEFKLNHQELIAKPDLDGGHEYFRDEFHDSVQGMVAAYQEILSSAVLERSGDDPKYDIINRQPGYETRPFYTKSAENTTTDTAIIASIPRTDSLGNLGGASEPMINPNVRDLFNLSASSNKTSNQALMMNMNNTMATVEQICNEIQILREQQGQDERIAALATQLKSRWTMIQKIHLRLIEINMDGYNATQYFRWEDQINPLLAKLKVPSTDDSDPTKQGHLKMPTINMPTFDGNYSRWRNFRDLFLEMMERKKVSTIEKLIYLKQALNGDCAKLISHLPLNNDNYIAAWTILERRYENPRQIMKATINRLLALEKAKSDSPQALMKIHDIFFEQNQAMKTASSSGVELLEMVLHQILLNKLDAATYALYEQSLDDPTTPQTSDDLLKFILKRFQALEQSNVNKSPTTQNQMPRNNAPPPWKKSTALVSTATNAKKVELCVCKDKHLIYKCPKFLDLNIQDRRQKVKQSGRCFNCFGINHVSKECKSRRCRTCNGAHNTLLHLNPPPKSSTGLLGSTQKGVQHVFLGTAIITVMDKNNSGVAVRALLDSGAQISAIRAKTFNRLGLKSTPIKMKIVGMGNTEAHSEKKALINLKSCCSTYSTSIEVYVMKSISNQQPSKFIDTSEWPLPLPDSVHLADPKFNIPAEVDILIGGELFYQLLSRGLINLGPRLPDLQNTVFGWMVIGKVLSLQTNKAFVGNGVESDDMLSHQLAQFWAIEEKRTIKKPRTTQEEECEKFYVNTTKRMPNGRFEVKLQFLQEPEEALGSSYEMATRRFFALERKLGRNQELKDAYCQFMKTYEELNHMTPIGLQTTKEPGYFIPHHAVFNPGSSTTKMRVVFDASAKTTSNKSLNEILANGPTLQDDLFTIMVRFRSFRYVFAADIAKMYRQIMISPEDHKYQKIVWREKPTDKLQIYKLNTLTYGVASASYQAIKTLQYLAELEREKYPMGSKIAERDFNVDDIMTGSESLEELAESQQQLIALLGSAGMELHKWCANHPELLSKIPVDKQEVSLGIQTEKTETKALGMKWIPAADTFALHYTPRKHAKITKRTVLSETAQLFDPLGLVNPVIVRAKIFLQELWQEKLDWDVELSEERQRKWQEFREQLTSMEKITVPRYALLEGHEAVEMHIFVDASTRAYGAVVYLRSTTSNGDNSVRILCSKSRVAPVNPITLPRLELCGAVTGIELASKVINAIKLKLQKVIYWTDSEIVLSWINNETSLKTFVANRISAIKQQSDKLDWQYMPTKENPADILSRGTTTSELLTHSLWWNGPEFLQKPKQDWPEQKWNHQRDTAEEKQVRSILIANQYENNSIDKINHGNSITKWQRTLAYCFKFGTSHPKQNPKSIGPLSKELLTKAMTALIKHAQKSKLGKEIDFIKNGQPEKTRFKTMTPILDADGILRVGGRLQRTDLPFEKKTPRDITILQRNNNANHEGFTRKKHASGTSGIIGNDTGEILANQREGDSKKNSPELRSMCTC